MATNVIQRPQSLAEYLGQDQAVGVLKVLLASSKRRGAPLPHVLMSGPAGLGKTTLARIVASEMGGRLVETIGATLKTPADIAGVFGDAKALDVVFIDEIHAMPRHVEELMYSVLEDGTLSVEDKSYGKMMRDLGLSAPKASSKTGRTLPPITVIGATTLLGSVSAPLRSRFASTLTLAPYCLDQMAAIVRRTAKQLGLSMTDEVAAEVGRRAKGTARIAVGHVVWLRDYAVARGRRITARAVQEAFDLKGIDQQGLTPTDRAYLDKLAASADAVGVETLAATLGESVETLEQAVEPFLLAQGYVERTPRGRAVTAKGRAIVGAEARP